MDAGVVAHSYLNGGAAALTVLKEANGARFHALKTTLLFRARHAAVKTFEIHKETHAEPSGEGRREAQSDENTQIYTPRHMITHTHAETDTHGVEVRLY